MENILGALYKMKGDLSYILLTAGGWAASHCLWNPELCCSRGIYLQVYEHNRMN